MQGGFKLKGRYNWWWDAKSIYEKFADLDATVDDVNKAIMPLKHLKNHQAHYLI